MRWLLLIGAARVALGCGCAPLASCVLRANGTYGCVCPFFGDGYKVCEEQRYVTEATVRASEGIGQWLGHVGGTPSKITERKLLSETQYVMEFDSTNYEAMVELTRQLNSKDWPYKVALLGSATSRVTNYLTVPEEFPLIELLNVTYNHSWWQVDLAIEGGMFFVSSEVVPLPCIHTHNLCCAAEYAHRPFVVGAEVQAAILRSCRVQLTNSSVQLAGRSRLVARGDNLYRLELHDDELSAFASMDSMFANLSVGAVDGEAGTQVQVSLRRVYFDYTVGHFTRQVVPYVFMQAETVENATYLHLRAQVLYTNPAVEYIRVSGDYVNWFQPDCNVTLSGCMPIRACTWSTAEGVSEMWVPLPSSCWLCHHGEVVSLYAVLREGKSLARLLTESSPAPQLHHCTEALHYTDQVHVQILQGLSMQPIYSGALAELVALPIQQQTDTLITFVARSATYPFISSMQAIHTQNESDVQALAANQSCPSCVYEQLVLNGAVVSPRSCFVFGSGDQQAWIERYVGLVGSRLAAGVLGRIPQDVVEGRASGAWINPVWPNHTHATFLRVNFGHGGSRRRLLQVSSASAALDCTFMVVAASVLLLYHVAQLVLLS